ncbi:pickpocket protein 28-like [Tribolium madens]|uniref:pickpocket protein 28-like n=1 Tax=Tribolium madens TaxID=41895 RepID=UPI001CF73011|nr:pickpocket protein 28-like [Tribolium madens]
MSLICDHNSKLNYSENNTFSDDFFTVIDKIKPKFQIQDCVYMKFDTECNESFVPIVTEDGICYTFNMLHRDIIFRDNVQFFDNYHVPPFNTTDWHLENGYIPNAGLSPYPLRAYLSGVLWGLSFKIVTPKQDLDYACKNSLQGYKVLLHTPMTIPRPNQKYFRIPLDQSVVGAVQPVMITTSETIKAYNPQRRKCYFAAERKLQFFQDYSASNCKLECLANWTSDLCDCVNFFMPRDNETEICGIGSLECMSMAESLMHMVDLSIKIEKPSDKGVKNFDCDCLPICSDLTYEVETSQTNWEWDKWLKAHRNLPRINNSHFSALTLFFKSDNFITSERNELYGPTDFLANFGGLLGLFTGFSVLSLMEILYFLSVRIFCNIRLHGQWFGSGSD